MQQETKNEWVGMVYFESGMGAFFGDSGDNLCHQHWAHQLVVGLENDISLCSGEHSFTGRAMWIEANTRHRLKGSKVISLYLEPSHVMVRQLSSIKLNPASSISLIKESVYLAWLDVLSEQKDLGRFVAYLKQQYWSSNSSPDEKIAKVFVMINEAIEKGGNASRQELAGLLEMSPSRFSHWFTEQTGVPFRSYKKWMRMLKGLELATHMNLTSAALEAGFSDQAHFCRAVIEAFGINPVRMKKVLMQAAR